MLHPQTAGRRAGSGQGDPFTGTMHDVHGTHSPETLSTLDVQLSSPSIHSGWPRC